MSFLSGIGSAVTKNIGSAVSPAAIASKVKNIIAGPDTTLGKLLPAVTSLPTVLANTKTKVVEVTRQAAANAAKKAINSKLGNGSAAPAASEEGAVASEEGAESYTNVVGANSGEGNAGEGNSGEGNAGEGNSGEGNSGEGNSGEGNAGEGNSEEGNAGEEQEGGRRKTKRRITRDKKRKNKSKNRRNRRSRSKKLA